MYILGLNAHHGDSAACLVRNGQLVAAAEEERFRRIKHWAGLPTEAVRYCLREGKIGFGHIDHIAINRKPDTNWCRRLWFVLRHRPDWRLVKNRLSGLWAARCITDQLGCELGEGRVKARTHHVEHHLAHMASAFMVSGFRQAVCLSVDGFGDFASAGWGLGSGRSIAIDGRIFFPHSLGIFYTAISQHLGFGQYGDEYKVMGLAAYGKPKFRPQMRELVKVLPDGTYRLNLKYFRHHRDNVPYRWQGGPPEIGRLASCHLETLLGPSVKPGEAVGQAHCDLACSAQEMFEEALFALLNALYLKYHCPNLALAGGCAMNSVANGKVCSRSRFTHLFVPPAASDAGGAIGAAFAVWNQLAQEAATPHGASSAVARETSIVVNRNSVKSTPWAQHSRDKPRFFLSLGATNNVAGANGTGTSGSAQAFVMSHAYVGPHYDREHIRNFLRSKSAELTAQNCLMEFLASDHALCARTARALTEGLVVGWFQGRMEWGPRALGNRSILGDPRRSNMKEILNAKIKRRESFRPFAPSVLREHVRYWFEDDQDVPFMMQVFQVRPEKRELVPATTHVDGSGRLHTVERATNPLYYLLISEFHSLTGIPMVLNTSFNENEPVVCRPEEALDCFLRTRMDILVMDRFFIHRQNLCAV